MTDVITVSDKQVAFHIPDELALMALEAAKLFEELPISETLKVESVILDKSEFRKTAAGVRDACAMVGFVFALEMMKARNQKLKELANASDNAETS